MKVIKIEDDYAEFIVIEPYFMSLYTSIKPLDVSKVVISNGNARSFVKTGSANLGWMYVVPANKVYEYTIK